jgi:hypothetical protein
MDFMGWMGYCRACRFYPLVEKSEDAAVSTSTPTREDNFSLRDEPFGAKLIQSTNKNPTPRVTGEWGWKDGWFSKAGLLAAAEDEGESSEAEKGMRHFSACFPA